MNKITAPTATLLLLSLNILASSDVPEMQMHIFKDESTSDSQPAMQMVIFSNEEHPGQHGNQNQISANNTAYQGYHNDAQYADQQSGFIDDPQDNINIEFYAEAGYRQDRVDWTIANSNGNPNILSELIWDNLEIVVIEAGMSMQTQSNWVLDGRFAYGTVLDGKNQDSDYFGNNRTAEFSRSNNISDEGNTIDATLGFGYRATIIPSPAHYQKPVLSFTPKIGASYHAQNLKILHGFQTIPAFGHFGGLDSSYDTSWYGPWAGFDTELSIVDRFSLSTSFEYHYAYFEATADWNLRSDLAHPKSFEHEAEGTGYIASIGSQFKLSRGLSLNLSVDYQKWNADKKGIDTVFLANGGLLETKLNEVNWESMGANIGLSYQF